MAVYVSWPSDATPANESRGVGAEKSDTLGPMAPSPAIFRRPAPTRRLRCGPLAVALGLAASILVPTPGRASEPLTFLGGRVRLGGEVSGTIAPDDKGFFNYSDYEISSLRLLRVDLAAEIRLGRRAAVLGELRSDNLSAPRVYAAYLRVRPWLDRELDLQVGLVPPVFGAWPRRRYGYDAWLPSLPLAYQYLTTLRHDAVPASAEQLVAQRGRGWLVSHPVGDPYAAAGLPLVSGERWDAGLQVRVGREPVSVAVALTQGSPSYPTVRDDNGGKQLSARLAWVPGPQLTVGLSGATGRFLSREVTDVLPAGSGVDFPQDALGADVEFARGRWILRGEAVWSRFRLPSLDETRLDRPLDAVGLYGELRCKLRPGLHIAGRVERLDFERIDSRLGGQTWDAPVTRLEVGGGYALRRQLLLKASWQHNWRDGGRVRENDLVTAQVLLWF